jgi:hypothetical protein
VNTRFRAPLSTAFAIVVGLVVLLSYFVELDLLASIRGLLLNWAMILAAVALLVGVANLFSVHWRKITSARPEGFYSGVLLLSLVATIVIAGYFGPTAPWSLWIFNHIQVPIESSLMAVLAVTLAFASARLLHRRLNWFSLIFVTTALIVLLGTAPLLGVEIPGLHGQQGLRSFIARIPAVAGARGLLLGVALGTVATGLRVLIGADRPYGS